MSARLLGLAFEVTAPSPAAKLVLIKLVDCCNDDGKKIFPAVGTIARAAQCTNRTVQRVLAKFCEVGLLRRVRDGGNGPGSTASYELNLDMLERLARADWKTVTGSAPEAFDETDIGAEGPIPPENKGDTMSPLGPDKGDTMMSPIDQSRMTSETAKGDMMCHPTPQDNPQTRGRESAGADARSNANDPPLRDGERIAAGEAMPAAMPTFDDFRRAWPTAFSDDRVRLEHAWTELPFDERRLALDGIKPFIEHRKTGGRKTIPAGHTYLRDRPWRDIKPASAASDQAASLTFPCWSRDWWAVLFAKIARGQKVAVMIERAQQNPKGIWAAKATDMPPPDEVERFVSRPSDGAALAAWRPWLEARGVSLPTWRGSTFWVFLPADVPPGHDAASAEWGDL